MRFTIKYFLYIYFLFLLIVQSQKLDLKNTQVTVDFIKEMKSNLLERNQRVEKFLDESIKEEFKKVNSLFEDKVRLENIILNKKDIDGILKESLSELNWLNLALQNLEAKAKLKWDENNKEILAPRKAVKGEIYGLSITANRLGVVLDKTSSLQNLEQNVKKAFKNSIIKTNRMTFMRDLPSRDNGLKIGQNEWFYIGNDFKGINPFRNELYISQVPNEPYLFSYVQFLEMDTLSTFKALVNIYEVDAILWNTEFSMTIDKLAFNELVRLMLKKKVKLYLLTGKDALIPKDFLKLVSVTKGSLKIIK